MEGLGAAVSMDGRGRWQDNVLIERLWRSVKHEWVLLHDYETLPELEELIGQWIERYNRWRPHTANDGQTPWEAYRGEKRMLERDELGLCRDRNLPSFGLGLKPANFGAGRMRFKRKSLH